MIKLKGVAFVVWTHALECATWTRYPLKRLFLELLHAEAEAWGGGNGCEFHQR